MKKAAIFLDGMITGTKLSSDEALQVRTKVTKSESTYILELLKTAKANDVKGEMTLEVPGESSVIRLALRYKGISRYLNLTGNPLTFLAADNVVGFNKPAMQIVTCFKKAIEYLEKLANKKLPSRIHALITKGDIQIHSLEFAAYTKELDKVRYMSTLQHVFGFGITDKGKRSSITSMLGIRITQNYDNQTIGIAFPYKKSGIEKRLLIYDKALEIGEDQPFLVRRLRYDIQLDYLWFSRRKIHTVRDMALFFKKKQGYITVIATEIQDCIKKACLEYMFTIKKSQLKEWQTTGNRPEGMRKDLDYATHEALFLALRMNVDREVLRELVNGSYGPLVRALKSYDEHENRYLSVETRYEKLGA